MEKEKRKKPFEHVSIEVVNVKRTGVLFASGGDDCGFAQYDADLCDGESAAIAKPVFW